MEEFDWGEEPLVGWRWKSGEHVHGSDPRDTSIEAAQKAERSAGPQMRLVFSFLLARAMTQDQLREATGLGDNAAKRCSDLKNRGWVTDGGARGLSNKGNRAVLWEVTEYGRRAFIEEGGGVSVNLDCCGPTGPRPGPG